MTRISNEERDGVKDSKMKGKRVRRKEDDENNGLLIKFSSIAFL